MLLSATFSKPCSNITEILGKDYEKIKVKIENSSGKTGYFMEMFTQKQVFHKHFTEGELEAFIKQHAGTTFKNCIERTDTEEITILANKKGKITRLVKKIAAPAGVQASAEKNYIIKEGVPVPFLVVLGVMTAEGKVVASRYSKFRQINRFLEFVDDVLPYVVSEGQPVRVADFGCGKSYLTFAVHYFLTEIKKVPCQIEGLDLKKDVIDFCNQTAAKLGLENLNFRVGNISDYSGAADPDIVMTLHACDTATDFALQYAVGRNAKAILSVPCCQHQINTQITNNRKGKIKQPDSPLEPILKHGLLREKFSSLLTDALRAEWLEQQGYKVQLLEFIDEEHTPKNILIRAVKKSGVNKSSEITEMSGVADSTGVAEPVEAPQIIDALHIKQELWN
ncbi:MAG: SAM-dependent methyltransferase [Treponema sp.]|nr:SAM-dependent methyltransferase [Treponema sp.]